MMRILLLTCIVGLAMLCGVCEGLSCHECLDVQLTSSVSDPSLQDILDSGSTSDPSCKQEGEDANIRTAQCKWENGVLDGSDLSDYNVNDGVLADYNSKGWDTVVCQKERSKLTAYVSGESITATIWSRGCKAVPSDVSMSCTDDVKNYEHALIAALSDGLRGQLPYGTSTKVSGNICFCDTDNCNSASLLTAPAWIIALPLLATVAALLNRG